jgi:hypothetical protein
MAGSPFNKKAGGTATAAAPAAKAADADDPTKADVTNLGEDKPIEKAKGSPFDASDPTGVSGYKPGSFMGQLVLMHPTETGWMKTSSNTPENPQSEYVRFDIIPLTVPEVGAPTRNPATRDDEGNVTVLNKDGEVETFEAYDIGERLEDVLIFNKPLVREGKKALEKGTAWLLGRITLGSKKPGQSAPVILVAGDDDDKAIYQEWRAAAAKAS